MRTLLVDNYLSSESKLEELYDVLKDVTVHTVEVKDYSSFGRGEEFKLYDVIVLSGSQLMLSEAGILDQFYNEVELIKETEKPLLGICFGHQLMAMAFGEQVEMVDKEYKGYYMVRKLEDDEMFKGLGDRFLVTQSHKEQVTSLPFDFVKLADSPNCPVEVMKHMILPKYGVQFHPERYDDKHPAGLTILENFFELAAWYQK
jgi:GMP synthase-like glutamine amidotransferase